MTQANQESRCSGRTKTGKPCRAAATEGGLCFFHANPKKASELGRIGGRKKGNVPVASDPLPNLDSVTAVRDAVKRVIGDVYAGKMHVRTAAGLAPLLHLQLRAIEKTDLEQRITRIEEQLNELKDKRGSAQQNEEGPGRRPAQGVKPYASSDGKILDHS